ncbi:MAG: hypothetical protein ACM31L_20745 [Actinomycetota bacterium]
MNGTDFCCGAAKSGRDPAEQPRILKLIAEAVPEGKRRTEKPWQAVEKPGGPLGIGMIQSRPWQPVEDGMRGTDKRSGELFSYVDLEKRVDKDQGPPVLGLIRPTNTLGVTIRNR